MKKTKEELADLWFPNSEESTLDALLRIQDEILEGMVPAQNHEGVLTFVDIKDLAIKDGYSITDGAAHLIMTAARQGMVSAANTIQIPDIKDWPAWAKRIEVGFYGEDHTGAPTRQNITKIERPGWMPEKGDFCVFWSILRDDQEAAVARITLFDRLTDDIDYPFMDKKGDTWQHCAKPVELTDMLQTIGWLKKNREWR